jgi:hypothetical protein
VAGGGGVAFGPQRLSANRGLVRSTLFNALLTGFATDLQRHAFTVIREMQPDWQEALSRPPCGGRLAPGWSWRPSKSIPGGPRSTADRTTTRFAAHGQHEGRRIAELGWQEALTAAGEGAAKAASRIFWKRTVQI